jgi:hypothetical protein
LLARGFVICDVSALIDHNLLHGCISREWCDSWCASQFAQTNGSQKRNRMLSFVAAATADAEEYPRDIHVYTIVAVTIRELVRSHTNKTCASRSHTLH